MKKSTMLSVTFVAIIVLMLASCEAFVDTIKESFTTAVAKYIITNMGGIEIKDFEEKEGVTPEKAGLIDENGIVPKSFTFNKPDKNGVGGIITCNELPLEFFKISNEVGKRNVGHSPYSGTWEAIVPIPQGFRKIYLELKDNYKCGVYFDVVPNDDVEIKTRVKTVLKGIFTEENGFVLNQVNDASGYIKSIKRFAGRLEKVGNDYNTLVAKFKFAGQFNTIKLFELQSGNQIKGTYIGAGDFAEEKVGTKITFEIDNNNFILTIPEGTKLPKKFTK